MAFFLPIWCLWCFTYILLVLRVFLLVLPWYSARPGDKRDVYFLVSDSLFKGRRGKCHLRVSSFSLCGNRVSRGILEKNLGSGRKGGVGIRGMLVTKRKADLICDLWKADLICDLFAVSSTLKKASWEFSPRPPPLPKGISGLRFYRLKSQEMAMFWLRVIYKQGTLGEGAGHLNEMHQHLTD